MKKIFFLLFFFLICSSNVYADGLRVGYLSPTNPVFSAFSNSFLNGLYLGLSENETVSIQSASEGVDNALENLYMLGADVIIGPFEIGDVKKAQKKICSSGIVTILPFAQPEYTCNNLFVYNYNPIKAAIQLAKFFSANLSGKTLILYAYDDLDIAKKDAFLGGLSNSDNIEVYVKGFEKSKSYDDFIKAVFGVTKIKQKSSLTAERVFKQAFNVNNIVIFAPQTDFINISNLLDYYGINVKHILSVGITVNNNLLSLSDYILRKMEFITPYYLCSDDSANVRFMEQYENQYQKDPDFMAALGYDIGRLLDKADRVSLESRLKQTADFDGAIGRLMFFDDKGAGLINYKLLNYEDIIKCKKTILIK